MTKKMSFFGSIAESLVPYFPSLKDKLSLADIKQTPLEYLTKVVQSAVLFSLVLFVATVLFLFNTDLLVFSVPLFFVYLIVLFFYFNLYADAIITKRKRELDYEIVFAGRHLVIALKSGMPLFDAMIGVTEGYGTVSAEFGKIVQKISVGTPMGQAIREVTQSNPSSYCVRVLMQVSNSLSSGADVAQALDSVLDQVSKEQLIQLKEYGQKLTPTVMFFMVFGIIMPSIGVVLATVLFSVISGGALGLTSSILFYVFGFIAVVQFLFLGFIESSRPKYLI